MLDESVSTVSEEGAPRAASAGLFGHPRGLTVLILTGIWENCALFGMRTVLVYYLVKQLHLPSREAVDIYALFSASALLGLLGGYAADRFLGLRRAVGIGIALMGVGLFMLPSAPLLTPALVLIAAGNGLTRPTLAAQVGLLYATDDARRDRGFTLYYVGCNVGAILAPLIAGTVGEAYGWKWAFIVCGAGMLLSLGIYGAGRQLVPDRQLASQEVHAPGGTATGRWTASVLILLGLVWLSGLLFWAAYGQIGSTVALWADQTVDRTIDLGGFHFIIPATWFQGINPLFIFAFAPLVNWWWARQGSRSGTSTELRKMTIGGVLLALCFALLALANWSGGGAPSWIWLVVAIAPFTIAELYFTPIGLGLFSRLALKRLVAVFVSLWSFAMMAGYAASGWLGHLWDQVSAAAFFATVAAVALSVSVVIPLAARLSRSAH